MAATATLGAKIGADDLRAAFDVDAAACQASASVQAQWADLRARSAALAACPFVVLR